MAAESYGFIGLGLMGLPMVRNLIKKTDDNTKFFVYDVSEKAVQELCKAQDGRVTGCKNSKEVAESSVCTSS